MTMNSLFMSYVVLLLVSFSVIESNHGLDLVHDGRALIPKLNYTITRNRKLIDIGNNRIWAGSCSKESIDVKQGATEPLPGSGIPTYSVIVENLCLSATCSISDIHLSCGWFASAKPINPNIFSRLQYDDCLVNDGQPLTPGQAITFVYANTYKYPLSVKSLKCAF